MSFMFTSGREFWMLLMAGSLAAAKSLSLKKGYSCRILQHKLVIPIYYYENEFMIKNWSHPNKQTETLFR